MAKPNQPPGFFKPIWVDRSSQTLEIPDSYVKHIKVRTSKNVNLKGPSGGSWTVKLVRRDGKLYFEKGWPEFMKWHSLRDMNICVFEYDGNVDFGVTILDGESGVNRVAFDPESSQGPPERSPSLSVSEDEAQEEAPLQDHGKHQTSEDRLSFVETMKSYYVRGPRVLNVPSWFTNEHFYSSDGQKLKIFLENEEGKQWQVILLVKGSALSGGWGRFVRDNHIKEGDTCTFEFVHRSKMLVHISRHSDSSQPKQHSQEAHKVFGDKRKRRASFSDDEIVKKRNTCAGGTSASSRPYKAENRRGRAKSSRV